MRLTDLQEYYSRSELDHLIDEFVFSDRDRKILKRRLLDGWLYKEISDEFHLDCDYTRKLVHKCEKDLFRRIERWEKKQNN